MADGITVDRMKHITEEQVVINIEGLAELDKFARTLNRIVQGTDIQKYWKDGDTLIRMFTESYRRFNKVADETNAKELITLLNALRGKFGTESLDKIVNGFEAMTQSIAKAEGMVGKVVNGLNKDAFSDMYSSFEMLKSRGLELGHVIQTLSDKGSLEELRATIARLSGELVEARERLKDLEAGEGVEAFKQRIAELEAQLKSANREISKLAKSAVEDFNVYLKAFDINPDKLSSLPEKQFRIINELMTKLEQGAITSKQAIMELRANCSELFKQSSYGLIDQQAVTASVTVTEGVARSLNAVSASGESLIQLPDLLAAIFKNAADLHSETQTVNSDLMTLLATINNIAHADTSNLESLATALKSLSNIASIQTESGSLKNTISIINSLTDNSHDYSRLIPLSSVSLAGFNGVKVDRSILYIADLSERVHIDKLEQLNGVSFEKLQSLDLGKIKGAGPALEGLVAVSKSADIQKLQSLADINWDNLNNLRIKKGVIEQISQLTEAVKVLKLYKTAVVDANKDSVEIKTIDSAAIIKQEAKAFEEARKIIEQYYATKTRLLYKGGDITQQDGVFVSLSGKNAKLVETMNQLEAAYARVTSEESRNALTAEHQAQLTDLIDASTQRLATTTDVLAKKQAEAAEAARLKAQSASAEAIAAKQQADAEDADAEAVRRSAAARKDAMAILRAYYELQIKAASIPSIQLSTDAQGNERWINNNPTDRTYDETARQLNEYLPLYNIYLQAKKSEVFTEKDLYELERTEHDLLNKLSGAKEDASNKAAAAAEREAAARERAELRATQASKDAVLSAKKLQNQYQNLISVASLKKHGEHYTALVKDKRALDELVAKYDEGRIGLEEFKDALAQSGMALDSHRTTINLIGKDTQGLVSRISQMAKSFSVWFGTTRLVMSAFRYFKQMVSASIELETAFNQLQIVTGATDKEMEKFAQTSFELAGSLGKSVSEVTKAIETFSRLGYSLSDAGELAKYATIMSNVASVDLEEATTGITSIIKGFDMDVSNAEHVADVLVEVGQKYAVSASEMMTAYEKSGAALNATNTSFEKSAGLIAAANAAVQNANTVGRIMPSITVM